MNVKIVLASNFVHMGRLSCGQKTNQISKTKKCCKQADIIFKCLHASLCQMKSFTQADGTRNPTRVLLLNYVKYRSQQMFEAT